MQPTQGHLIKCWNKQFKTGRLTEVFECLFDLLGGQVEPGLRRDEGSVQPVIAVVPVDGVSPQPVHWQLLLQKTDDLELWQVSTVAHI